MRPIRSVNALIKSNAFLRHNLIYFAGSMGVAFLNYLYYPVMGRLMTKVSFGELQVIISAFMQLTTILSVVSLVAIGILINESDSKKARATVAEFEKISLYIGLAIALLVVILSLPLQHALKFTAPYPFIAIAAVFIVTIPLTFRTAYLRAKKDFSGTSLSAVFGSTAKLIFSVILVLLAFKTLGAVVGILIAQVVALTYTARRAKKLGQDRPVSNRKIDLSLLRPEAKYAGFVLIVSTLTTLQISVDVTIVKFFFSPDTAGSYAAVATIARIVFFLTGSIIAVLLSSLSTINTAAENRHLLTRSLLLVSGIGGAATIFFGLFPQFVMHLLLGARYDTYASLLPLLSLTIFIGSLVTLFTTYNIALKQYRIIPIVVIGSIVTVILTTLNHASLSGVITNLLIGNTVMLTGLAAISFTRLRNELL